jgi:hypothetical protein
VHRGHQAVEGGVTPVRSKRSDMIHATTDLRRTLCDRRCDGWIVEPDTAVMCKRCRDAAEFN